MDIFTSFTIEKWNENSHRGESIFCKVCGSMFPESSNLKMHLHIET